MYTTTEERIPFLGEDHSGLVKIPGHGDTGEAGIMIPGKECLKRLPFEV